MINLNSIAENLIESNKKEIEYLSITHSKCFLIICDKNYIKYTNYLIKSINLFSSEWSIIVIVLGDSKLNKLININSYNTRIINLLKIKDLNLKSTDMRALAANLRAAILYNLSNNNFFKYLIYIDADSLLINDPTFFCDSMFKNNDCIAFRKDPTKLFNKKTGCIAFKSGVIVCINKPSVRKLLIEILKDYADFVSLNWQYWYADQWGLTLLVSKRKYFKHLNITESFLNDWQMNFKSLVWSAKGNRKETKEWAFLLKIINNIYFPKFKNKRKMIILKYLLSMLFSKLPIKYLTIYLLKSVFK